MNEPTAATRSPLLPIAIAGLLVVAVTAGVLFFLNRPASAEFDPMASASLAPEDTHLYLTFNTDFTSDPWIAVPRLLAALGIEDNVRENLRESTSEESFDYEDDIVPALATIRRLGLAVQYTGSEDGEAVIVIDSRDRQQVLDLFAELSTGDAVSESRDEELGLDFDAYVIDGDTLTVTVDNDVIYAAEEPTQLSNFIRRQREQAPLSESQRFIDAVDAVDDDSLMVGYGNGAIFDHRDFRDLVDAFAESAEVDPRAASLAFSVTARNDGFGARAVVSLESGFGTLSEFIADPADIAGLAALAPDDTLFFAAGSGLHDALVEAYDNIEEQSPELLEVWLYPFEDMTGLSLERDLLPAIGSSYGIAVGGDDIGADDFAPDSLWFVGLIESNDPPTLRGYFELLIDEFEIVCACDSGVQLGERAGYLAVQWPDRPLSDVPLADSEAFQRTLALLPADPSSLYFLNLAALPEAAIAELTAEIAADPDGYDFNLDAVQGFAIAGAGDETSFSFDMVLPITGAE